mmetsp:Transcript_143680/g.358140  ORF Transcript_143680/g.358140 Transcript_143680/m.358140 type:complete len:127 (+) Transcript_143680:85-465(+)
MMWTMIAYFIAPLGIAVWALLMTGWKPLHSISRAVVGLTVSIGPMKVSLAMFIALFSAIVWSWETIHLYFFETDGKSTTLGYHTDQQLMKKWRNERNWWILNFNLLLWLTNWRACSLLSRPEDKSQ